MMISRCSGVNRDAYEYVVTSNAHITSLKRTKSLILNTYLEVSIRLEQETLREAIDTKLYYISRWMDSKKLPYEWRRAQIKCFD